MGGVVGAVGRVAGDASLALAAILFAIAIFIWAIFVVRKLTRDEARARRRITELEVPRWLEGESAATLGEALAAMREAGRAFNIGVRIKSGELIEAEGRAAGGLATLRLRPLAGERRDRTELAYDSRKLGKQVERL